MYWYTPVFYDIKDMYVSRLNACILGMGGFYICMSSFWIKGQLK